MNFIIFIVAQQSSQPNFRAFPSQTLSASPPPQPVSLGNHKFFKVCAFKKKKIFYGSKIDLQYCVCFRHMAKRISFTYAYVRSVSESFPTQVTTESWVDLPWLYNRSPGLIRSINSSVYVSIPASHCIPPPGVSPLVTIRLVSKGLSQSLSVVWMSPLYPFLLDSTYYDLMWYLSFSDLVHFVE